MTVGSQDPNNRPKTHSRSLQLLDATPNLPKPAERPLHMIATTTFRARSIRADSFAFDIDRHRLYAG